jgi:serine/threonine protein kinase
VLPDLVYNSDNANGAVCSRSGYVFPPFFVLKRGTTLRDWCRGQSRGFFEVINMAESVAKQLDIMHHAGYVHRDLKPENVLYMMNTSQWRLLDLGIVARKGVTPVPTLSVKPQVASR